MRRHQGSPEVYWSSVPVPHKGNLISRLISHTLFCSVSYLAVWCCKRLVWNERSTVFDCSCPSTISANGQKAESCQATKSSFLLSFLGKWRERLRFKFSETQRKVRVRSISTLQGTALTALLGQPLHQWAFEMDSAMFPFCLQRRGYFVYLEWRATSVKLVFFSENQPLILKTSSLTQCLLENWKV